MVWIDYDSILGWGVEGYRPTCFTLTDSYYWPNSLEDFEKLEGCERTDRSSVVKMDKVTRYDKTLKTLHFSEDHEPYANVSRKHRKRLSLD